MVESLRKRKILIMIHLERKTKRMKMTRTIMPKVILLIKKLKKLPRKIVTVYQI